MNIYEVSSLSLDTNTRVMPVANGRWLHIQAHYSGIQEKLTF